MKHLNPLLVPDEVYDAVDWNGNSEVPTKNAIRDIVETVIASQPQPHETSHKSGGSDEILLNEFGSPTGSVQFNQQQGLQFRLENRTSDPISPSVGEIWLRTDL